MKTSATLNLILVIFISHSLYAQNIDTLQEKAIKTEIEKTLKEKEYTRIPNKDFDELINNKVSSVINEKFTYWATVIGIFVTTLAGLAAYAFNNKMKQLVSEQVKRQSEEEFKSIRKYILDSRKYTLKSDLELLKNKVKLNSMDGALLIEAKTLFNEIKELKNKELLAEIVDLLTILYYTKKAPREIEKLIESNEEECEIIETTYMNAAILYADLYELDGSNWYKENCIKYCKIAAQKVPHYGEPQGIMLLVQGIDYVNNPNQSVKQTVTEMAKELINEILTGSDSLTAYYTVNRLERDRVHSVFGKYIKAFEQAIPTEFSKLYERASQYEQRSTAPII